MADVTYYTKQGSYTAGTKARAETVSSDYDAIVTGFTTVNTHVKRAIKIPSGADVELTETAGQRANKVVGADASGTIVWKTVASLSSGFNFTATGEVDKDVVAYNASAAEYQNFTLSALGADAFASGTKLIFFQTAAPTGWTFDGTNSGRTIINAGTVASGGTIGGSWTISGLSVDGHTLSTAELAAHSHGISDMSNVMQLITGSGAAPAAGSAVKVTFDLTSTDSAGSNSPHTHGLTADGAWRPAYLKGILCSKD